MARGFSNTKPMGEKAPRLEELVDVYELPDKTWVQVRFTDSDILPIAQHWIEIEKKDGSGKTSFPKLCLSWDADKEEHDPDIECPYCEAGIRSAVTYYANAIIREDQENKPENPKPPSQKEAKTGFKEKESKAWTPVKVIRLTPTFVSLIKDLQDINKQTNAEGRKEKFDVSHVRYGMDVQLRVNSDKTGQGKFTVNGGEMNALSKEERKYLVWDLNSELIKRMGLESLGKAKSELARLPAFGGQQQQRQSGRHADYDVSEDDNEEMLNKKKGRKYQDYDDEEPPVKKKKSRSESYEDYDDEESPRKSAKSYEDDDETVKKRKKPKEEAYEEYDEPAPKKRSSKSYEDDDEPPVKKRKKQESYEDFDEEPPVKKKKPVKDYDDDEPVKKKVKSSESYDDDSYYSDDDDEPATPKKKRRNSR